MGEIQIFIISDEKNRVLEVRRDKGSLESKFKI